MLSLEKACAGDALVRRVFGKIHSGLLGKGKGRVGHPSNVKSIKAGKTIFKISFLKVKTVADFDTFIS